MEVNPELGNPVELNDHFPSFTGLPKECSTSGNVLRTEMERNMISTKKTGVQLHSGVYSNS